MPQDLPRGIWMLGFVSLFMDVSSEMIHAMLPLFVVGTLGASAALLGLLEGIAEATAQISKLFSGVLSDRWRKPQGAGAAGLWHGGGGEAAVSAGHIRHRRVRGALRRPDRQGHPRARRAMRWWPTSRRLNCAARPSACASRSTRWGPSPGR